MIDSQAVSALIRTVAAETLMSRFGRLSDRDIRRKAHGELVTDADEAAEAALSAGLARIEPGAALVGEEGAAARPDRIEALRRPGPAWIIDPLDGTANFAKGNNRFCVIVARHFEGSVTHGWIHDPNTGQMAIAEVGQGVFVDGRRVHRQDDDKPLGGLRGLIGGKLDESVSRQEYEKRVRRFGSAERLSCAGLGYLDLVLGGADLLCGRITKPWDHAAGALMVLEAGGWVARVDGTPYLCPDWQPGLLAGASRAIWQTARANLMGEESAQ